MTGSPGSIQAYQRQSELQRRDELILAHLPLVKHVIGRLLGDLPRGVDAENLQSAGVLGLIEAAAKYDPTQNAQFKTFAYLRIRGAILDELRRNSPLPQHVHTRVTAIRRAQQSLPQPVTVEALATATGLTPDEVTDALAAERLTRTASWDSLAGASDSEPAEDADSPHDTLERWELTQQLAEAIETLSHTERLAVTLYYREDMRLREISEVMKISPSRISRILSKAAFELGEVLRTRLGMRIVGIA